MRKLLPVLYAALFLLLAAVPAFASGTDPAEIWVDVSVASVPEGAVYLDLLAPEGEIETVPFRALPGAPGVTAESGIAGYADEGFVSLSFRAALPEVQNRLAYKIGFFVPIEKYKADPSRYEALSGLPVEEEGDARAYTAEVLPGSPEEAAMLAFIDSHADEDEGSCVCQTVSAIFKLQSPLPEFSALRAAYLDENGEVLLVSNTLQPERSEESILMLTLEGERLSPTSETLLYEEYVRNDLLVFAVALLVMVLLMIASLLLLRRAKRKAMEKYLPAFVFRKNAPSDPVLKGRVQRAANARGLFVLAIAVATGVATVVTDAVPPEEDPFVFFGGLALSTLTAAAIVYLNLLLHECGHALVGKLTGYDVTAMQVGGLLFTKQNGRLRRSRSGLPAGAGALTALSPTAEDPAEVKLAPMYLAGGLVNLVLGILSAAAYRLLPGTELISLGLLLGAVTGFMMALQNLVPFLSFGAGSDGRRLHEARKSPEEKAALIDDMRISAALYAGGSITGLPESLFPPPEGDLTGRPLYAANLTSTFFRLLALGKYEDALFLGERLTAAFSPLSPLEQTALLPDMLTLMVLTGRTREEIEGYFCKERRALLQAAKPGPATLVSKYLWESRVEADAEAAEASKKLFEKESARELPWRRDLNRTLMGIDENKEDAS